MNDPIVIDPPGFDQQASWDECCDYVDKCGGLVRDDGEPNWRAAFGADPGVCSCPVCDEFYWAWGRVQQCTKCGFQYPTDWWSMFSWGSQAATRNSHDGGSDWWKRLVAKRMQHKYYRWAFENKPAPSMETAKAIK